SVESELRAIDQALSANPNDEAARARAARFNEATDERLGLITAVDMGEGRVVSFYLNDGVRAIGLTGPMDGKPVFGESALHFASFAEVYEYLKPGEAIPEAVTEADAARDAMLAQREEAALTPQVPAAPDVLDGSDSTSKHATNSCTHFQDD